MNGDIDFADLHSANAKLGLDIIFAQTVHQFITCRHTVGQLRLAKGVQRIAVHLGGGMGQVCKRLHDGALSFVDLVKHGLKPLNLLHCSNIAVVVTAKWSRAPNFIHISDTNSVYRVFKFRQLWQWLGKHSQCFCCSGRPRTCGLCQCRKRQILSADAPFGLCSGPSS